MISVSRPEVCAVACAEVFRDAGEIMVSPMATMVSIGAQVGAAHLLPDILLTDGEAQLLAATPAIGAQPAAIEGWMPFGRSSKTLALGAIIVVMGANQVGTVSAIRTCRRSGRCSTPDPADVRCPWRAPGNTINHATSYWVGNRSRRVFGDSVGLVSGHRLGQGRSDNPAYRFVNVLPGGIESRGLRHQRA